MAAISNPLSLDSAAELYNLIGEDASASPESELRVIDSSLANIASSKADVFQRDTDDTEDSEEEFEEEEDEDDDLEDEDENEVEDEDDEDEDLDPDEEEEDEDEEVGVAVLQATGSTNLRGPVVNGNTSVESELVEDDDAGDENVAEDEYAIESGEDEADGADTPETDRAIDSALRMSALATVTSEYAASV
jgi:hypothetical protein